MSFLEQCFQMFGGISAKREQSLYNQGIVSWDQLADYLKSPLFFEPSFPSRLPVLSQLERAKAEFDSKNWAYFLSILPSPELWRLYPFISERFLFLDIETNGLGKGSYTTVVSLYQKGELKTFIRGRDLEFLLDEWKEDNIFVTYNGKRFDIPFLENEFNTPLKNLHLDLMNVLHGMGIKGGLKKSEEILQLPREPELQGMDGSLAPRLWHSYAVDDNKEALSALIRYNQADVLQLEKVLLEVMKRKKV